MVGFVVTYNLFCCALGWVCDGDSPNLVMSFVVVRNGSRCVRVVVWWWDLKFEPFI